MQPTLNVHSIESFGTHDGPGIRLVVFLQGCNLKCKYCQNPDTIDFGHAEEMTVGALVKRAIQMRAYFKNGGGVTVSGGEPMLQSKAIIPFFEKLQEHGIHTNVDTNGTISGTYSDALIELSDLMMFDIKQTNSDKFKNLTEQDALATLKKNIALRESVGKEYWLRYVLVPGYTDSDADLLRLIDLFGNRFGQSKFELIPYHTIGKHKWNLLGWEYGLSHVSENTEEQLQKAESVLKAHFKNFHIKR